MTAMDIKIPKSITPSPIIEAITELRFENELPSAILFGKLYAGLSTDFEEVEQLPILSMPEEFRKSQPGLTYAPHYRLKNDKYLVNVGQNSLSVNHVCIDSPYTNWAEYKRVIDHVFELFQSTNVVSQVSRLSVAYVNLFDSDITSTLNLSLDFLGGRLTDQSNLVLSFRKELENDEKVDIKIGENAEVDLKTHKRQGLVLNISAFKETTTAIEDISMRVDSLHQQCEKFFFSSLNPKYVEGAGPKYE